MAKAGAVSRTQFLRRIGITAAGVAFAGQASVPASAEPLGHAHWFSGLRREIPGSTKDWGSRLGSRCATSGFQSVDLGSDSGVTATRSLRLRICRAKQIRQKLDSIGMVRVTHCRVPDHAELHQSFEEKMAFSHEVECSRYIICAPDLNPDQNHRSSEVAGLPS